MKHLISFLAVACSFGPCLAQSGKLNVSFYGVICHQQTNDDLLGLDGIGDEVYCAFTYGYTTKPNTAAKSGTMYTKTMGERSSLMSVSEYYSREKAGSVSANGGLKSGDHFTSTHRVSIFQNVVIDKETVLFILPSIWEDDKQNVVPDPRPTFRQILTTAAASATFNAQVRNEVSGLDANTINSRSYIVDAGRFGLDAQWINTFKHVNGQLQSKPIGMNASQEFKGKVMVLTPGLCMRLAQHDYGYGRGVVPILFSDPALGNTTHNGIYSILILFEFLPDPVQITPLPVITPTAVLATADSVKKPVVFIARLNTSAITKKGVNSLVGTWAGTYTSGKEKSISYYAIRIMSDKTLQVLDENGNSIASGSYTLKDNKISGSYRYERNMETFNISATVEGNEMNGSWGTGLKTNGSFKLARK